MSNLYYQVSSGSSPTGDPGTVSSKNRGSVLSKGFTSFLAMAFFLLVGNVAHAQLAATLFVDQDVTCNGGTDGIIRLTASGGPVPYSYAWSDGATSDQNTPDGTVAPDGSTFSLFGSTRTGVAAGVYSVTVTDNAAGTAVAMSVTVTQPDAIAVIAAGTDLACNGDNSGSISTTVAEVRHHTPIPGQTERPVRTQVGWQLERTI
ncbi:SprB repeat-containing protein [Cryomorphaceae bacterium]|nr:SprB repeat-containing protein [Cryomorphaceae bacterium]